MQNIINLDEHRLKKKINKAYEVLREVRMLISYGDYERVQEAIDIEKTINNLEIELMELIESDS